MTTLKIIHLIDDTTAGGVMRMLEHLTSDLALGDDCDHTVRHVNRNAMTWGHMDADVIVNHVTPGWRGLPAFASLRAMHPGTRLIHVEHSYTRAFTALNVPHRRRFFSMLRVTYSLFDHIVAVSRNQAVWLQDRGLVSADRVSVIEPQVDLSEFSAVPAPSGQVRTIGAIGRLDPQKGFDVLIKAFRACAAPDARLLIFGDGQDRDALVALAGNDRRIEFRGHTETPQAAYAAVDLVVMPSRWEAYGIVADEALAAGRPVLVSPVDGLADRIGRAGVMMCKLDPRAWTNALMSVLHADTVSQPVSDTSADQRAADYIARWMRVLTVPVETPAQAA